MHVHIPKAPHSLREFLVEIGTITAGILIALGLEAGVEAWHHQELVEQASTNLRRELQDNRKNLAKSLATERSAVEALGKMGEYANSRMSGGGSAEPKIAINVDFAEMRTAAWESTVATQALSYMPYEDAQALALAYSGSRTFNGLQQEARKPYIEMAATISGKPEAMNNEQLREVQQTVAINRMYATTALATGHELLKVYDSVLGRLD